MNRIARALAAERADVFQAAAVAQKLSPVIIEKDFWVCWTLERLFTLPEVGANLLFKGGTSLSKVYGVIERFSEDIDLSLSRDFLGFGGEREPELAASKTQQRKRIEELLAAFYAATTERTLPTLHAAIAEVLGEEGWTLTPTEPGTLEFAYPLSLGSALAYIRSVVKIEMGARNDTWPAEEHPVVPYAAEVVAGTSAAAVRVLAVERTSGRKSRSSTTSSTAPWRKSVVNGSRATTTTLSSSPSTRRSALVRLLAWIFWPASPSTKSSSTAAPGRATTSPFPVLCACSRRRSASPICAVTTSECATCSSPRRPRSTAFWIA